MELKVMRPGMLTTATQRMGTWEITGEKAYVVNADRAESFVVFAQTQEAAGWRTEIPLTFQAGVTTLGPVAIGPAPKPF